MLDYNILRWSWSQRFILLSYVMTCYYMIGHPYAKLNTELITKSYHGALNIFCYATVLCLFAACLKCYGYYKIKLLHMLYGVGGCIVANLLFMLVAFSKDRRLPTGSYFLSLLWCGITCLCIWYDISHYRYEEK
jgi:hypothetical protein